MTTARGQVVVVTGASAGVGRAIARRFAGDGAQLALLGRNRAGLEAAREEAEAAGARALVFVADVADPGAVESAAAGTEEALGPIDVWVNNAMATVFAFFDDIEPDEYRRTTDVTYHGVVWGTRAALRRMMPRDRGTIVQVGSALAYRGIPLQAPYCGAKHAIRGFQESVRTELRHRRSHVRLTMVQLPGLNTPQFDHGRAKVPNRPMPVPPIYQPEVAAEAVHWAAMHARREIWVGAPTVYTIVGNKIAPGLLERYLARTAIDSQQTDEPLGERVRDGNLFQVPGHDEGARGRFGDGARGQSIQFALSRHRRELGAAVLAGLAAAGGRLLAR